MQACSAHWASMKGAGAVPAGMKWTAFLKTCNPGPGTVAKTPVAQINAIPGADRTAAVPTPAKATVVAAPNSQSNSKSTAGGQLAEQSRMKQCGTDSKSAKAANTLSAGETWLQFWIACDARLEGASG
jgi:hypothetical protein